MHFGGLTAINNGGNKFRALFSRFQRKKFLNQMSDGEISLPGSCYKTGGWKVFKTGGIGKGRINFLFELCKVDL